MPVFQSIVGLNHRCFIFSFLFFFPKSSLLDQFNFKSVSHMIIKQSWRLKSIPCNLLQTLMLLINLLSENLSRLSSEEGVNPQQETAVMFDEASSVHFPGSHPHKPILTPSSSNTAAWSVAFASKCTCVV